MTTSGWGRGTSASPSRRRCLAVAEQTGASGAAFTDALVIAYEVAHRLTTMYPDTRLGPYAAGYHKPSVYSHLGATAGAARLLARAPTPPRTRSASPPRSPAACGPTSGR